MILFLKTPAIKTKTRRMYSTKTDENEALKTDLELEAFQNIHINTQTGYRRKYCNSKAGFFKISFF